MQIHSNELAGLPLERDWVVVVVVAVQVVWWALPNMHIHQLCKDLSTGGNGVQSAALPTPLPLLRISTTALPAFAICQSII